jgi:hypothetical protein
MVGPRTSPSSPILRSGRDQSKPVGVPSDVTKLLESLPEEFRSSLPSPEEFEAEPSQEDKGPDVALIEDI